jgi:hypothetical protein
MPPLLARPGTTAVPYGTRAGGTGRPHPPEILIGPRSANEVIIGMALTTKWMLTTGRRLDQTPLLHDLTADQLIDFWADDHDGGTAYASRPAQRYEMTDTSGSSASRPKPADSRGPKHCAMLAVDITAFSGRTPSLQLHLRNTVYQIMKDACEADGVPWDDCRVEDRGDGLLLIAPPDVSVESLLAPLIAHILSALRWHNKMASRAAQLRLRMAVHAGFVHFDDHGAAGKAVIHLFRLLEAPTLKTAFTTHGGDFALMVSDYLYQEIIQDGPGLIEPTAFRDIPVDVKETHDHGWMWLPSRRNEAPTPNDDNLPAYGLRFTRLIHWPRHNGTSNTS